MVARSAANARKNAKPSSVSSGTALALLLGVRPITRPDEHTTIAIRHRADEAEAGATLTVPSNGIDIGAVERALIQFALETHRGNRTHAAAFLGLSRSALLYRMHKYGLIPNADGSESKGDSHQ